jgi:selenophosphate synthase
MKLGPQFYLLDMMEDLNFYSHQQIDKNYDKIEDLLQRFNVSMIIDVSGP